MKILWWSPHEIKLKIYICKLQWKADEFRNIKIQKSDGDHCGNGIFVNICAAVFSLDHIIEKARKYTSILEWFKDFIVHVHEPFGNEDTARSVTFRSDVHMWKWQLLNIRWAKTCIATESPEYVRKNSLVLEFHNFKLWRFLSETKIK